MYKTHNIQLNPTNSQRTQFLQATGTARFTYNWALHRWNEQYQRFKLGELDTKLSQYSLRKELNTIKRNEFPWMLDVTKCAPEAAIINLSKAFEGFWLRRSKYPRFKKRGINDTFKVSAGKFTVDSNRIRLPKIGWVRMCESYRFPTSRPISVTVSRKANRWYASITADVESTALPALDRIVGVDVGVNEYVTSDGVRYQVPRSYRASERKIRRAQQSFARKQKGSNNSQ